MTFNYKQQPGMKCWIQNRICSDNPLISIITPYYNSGKYFKQTYQCVMNQTFPWFEWIIVDDGSSEAESLAILDKIVLSDTRIKVLHQENSGASAARNTGINASTTDLIFPLDSDDLIEPTCLEYEYWALHFNPEATWAYSDSIGFQDEEYIWDIPFDPERMKYENLLTITALIRKKAAMEVGLYSTKNEPFDEDWHFWLKLLARGGYPVQIKGEYLFWYRRRFSFSRFSAVHEDMESEERNSDIIAEEAQYVVNPSAPIYYPNSTRNNYQIPKLSNWNLRVHSENNKTCVLFIIPWMSMGGADKFNLDLIAGLEKERYEVSVITTERSNNAWLQKFRKVTPEIFNLPNFLSPNDYPEFISYVIKSRNIDILFLSNSCDGYHLLPWIRKNFRDLAIIDYVHMEEWYWKNGGYARTSGIMGDIVERTYVCNSATNDVMIKYFQRKKSTVETVHIGIDTDCFDASKIRNGLLNKEIKMTQERPVVLFICRLTPQKRPFLMLQIAQCVKQDIPDVLFAVIGSGEQEAELKAVTKDMGLSNTVYFLGAKNEVRPYYRDAKVTLICSMKEGLALTAYESCSMGVPVVSADVGGQKDLIDDTVGVLIPYMQNEEEDFDVRNFPQEEISAYSKAIIKILSDSEYHKLLSSNCRKKVLESFTIAQMIKKFDVEFQYLISDQNLLEQRRQKSDALQMLGLLAGEVFTLNLVTESSFQDIYEPSSITGNFEKRLNNQEIILARHEEVVNRHEDVLNRHEDVLNRHEGVVNHHEASINHQWEVQKWHEERLAALENKKSFWRKVIERIHRIK